MRKSSPKRSYKDYLLDMEDALNKIEKFSEGFDFEKFCEDEKTQEAIIRKFEIVGEAVGKVPVKVKKEHASIPWKKISNMRNKLIHEYFGINKEVVWKTIKEDIPTLKGEMLKLMKNLLIA